MTPSDLADVQAVGRSAGERFRSISDPRIARCADDPPIGADALRAALAAGAAWVATDGDPARVVGFLVVETVDGAAHVEEVAVAPEFGGRGHASALLDAAARWAVERGLDALTLTTFRDVPFNRPFYERRGFRVLEEDELTPALVARRAEEDRAGLPAEVRVVMRRDLTPAPPRVAIRDAVESDMAAVLPIYNEVVLSSAAIWRDDPETLAERLAWFRSKQAEGWPVLVAEVAGEVVAFAAAGSFRSWPGYWPTAEHSIHVAAAHRGAGLGQTLLEALIERVRAMGKQVLIAAVDGGNSGSIGFHERLGFRLVAHLPAVGRKFGEPVDLVHLQRDLLVPPG
jgi:L-amino acid N-acyltransferase